MKILPLNSNYSPAFKAGENALRKKAPQLAEEKRPELVVIKNNSIGYTPFVNDKRKAGMVIRYELIKKTKQEISDKTREQFEDEIKTMENGIVDMCINYDDYRGQGFNYKKTLEHFADWKSYVEENNDRLSDMMNAPYELTHQEKVPISSYAKKNPDAPESEIIQSSLYKIYILIKLNKPQRTHFHD